MTFLLLFSLTLSVTVKAALAPVSFNDVLNLEVRDPDARVSYGNADQQFGELWLTRQPSRGLIIFVHGGCWLNQFDVGHSRALAGRLTEEGFNVWSLEYRRLGDKGGGIPGTFEDLSLASASLSKLEPFGVKDKKVIVAGHSAGGHLALWTAARHPTRFIGAVGLAAITDPGAYAQGDTACEKAARKLMQGTMATSRPNYEKYSPKEMQLHPKTHLIQGTADRIIPVSQAKALGLDDDKVRFTRGGHFDLIHPGTRDFESVKTVVTGLFE